jgi:cytochrome c5
MKAIRYPLLAGTLLLLAYCKSTKSGSGSPSVSTPAPEVKSAGYVPSDKQMDVAQRRWPNTVASEVSEGHLIYETRCSKCHMAFDIMEFSEIKWIHEIDKMAPKANLSPEEKLKLSKHILSYREANAPVKPN